MSDVRKEREELLKKLDALRPRNVIAPEDLKKAAEREQRILAQMRLEEEQEAERKRKQE